MMDSGNKIQGGRLPPSQILGERTQQCAGELPGRRKNPVQILVRNPKRRNFGQGDHRGRRRGAGDGADFPQQGSRGVDLTVFQTIDLDADPPREKNPESVAQLSLFREMGAGRIAGRLPMSDQTGERRGWNSFEIPSFLQ